MLYSSILLPVDLGHPETAPAMFEKAKALLESGGKLTAVYVLPDIPACVLAEMQEGFLAATMHRSGEELRSLVADAGVDAEIRILDGQAARAILSAAEDIRADLVIVSSHRPDLSDYLLGSTAARVVRHAQCSVLVIR